MSERDNHVCLACTQNLDKTAWGPGPWQEEPDFVEFVHAGLPCILHRNFQGAWCGYAAVPPGHPYYKQSADDVYTLESAFKVPQRRRIDVHGGLTYAGVCDGHICHAAKPGEPEEVFWLGFDCGHCYDYMPWLEAKALLFSRTNLATRDSSDDSLIYRDVAFVRNETERLALALEFVGRYAARLGRRTQKLLP